MERKHCWLTMMIWATLAALPAAQGAEEAEMQVRSFNRFEQDSETASGLWVEVPTAFARETEGGFRLDVTEVAPRIVYGWPFAEVGIVIPYVNFHLKQDLFFGPLDADEDGIGDVRLYGKGALRSEFVDGGIGLQLTFPSGDEEKGLGAGEVGFLPFGTGAVHIGPVDLRAHVGYLTFADGDERSTSLPDAWVYGWGLFAAIGAHFGPRAEFAGFNADGQGNALTFEPGFDVRIPLGAVDFLVRPTGLVGLSETAPDWGLGGGIAVSWNPERP